MRFSRPAVSGSRDELAKQLRDMSEGWKHLGKDSKSEAAKSGAETLASSDATSVQVGQTTYIVTD